MPIAKAIHPEAEPRDVGTCPAMGKDLEEARGLLAERKSSSTHIDAVRPLILVSTVVGLDRGTEPGEHEIMTQSGSRSPLRALRALAVLFVAACGTNTTEPPSKADAGAAADAGAEVDAAQPDATTVCSPGKLEPCYSGPPETRDVGACHSGVRACSLDGSRFGSCLGELLPIQETCATPVDDDCDGLINEEGMDCTCVAGTAAECYSGAAESLGVGPCKAGTQVCKPNGIG